VGMQACSVWLSNKLLQCSELATKTELMLIGFPVGGPTPSGHSLIVATVEGKAQEFQCSAYATAQENQGTLARKNAQKSEILRAYCVD